MKKVFTLTLLVSMLLFLVALSAGARQNLSRDEMRDIKGGYICGYDCFTFGTCLASEDKAGVCTYMGQSCGSYCQFHQAKQDCSAWDPYDWIDCSYVPAVDCGTNYINGLCNLNGLGQWICAGGTASGRCGYVNNCID